MKIIGVAIITENNLVIKLPAPNRHGDCVKKLAELNELTSWTPKIVFQGFYLNDNSIISRELAYDIAQENGQSKLKRKFPVLYSEDIW